MTRDPDFADAHRRHLEDAELLHDGSRWANADHLYGLSAECGLKAVMSIHGIPIEGKKYRKHVPDLWSVFEGFARGHSGKAYLKLLPDGVPFADWSIDGRYANRRDFESGNVMPHRDAARRIRLVVQNAEQDRMP